MLLRALGFLIFISALILVAAGLFMHVPAPTYGLWLFGLIASETAPTVFLLALAVFALSAILWRSKLLPGLSAATMILSVLAALAAGLQTASVIAFCRDNGFKLSLADCLLFASHRPAVEKQVYATIDGKPLELDVYRPQNATVLHGAVVVIHGGGWRHGHRSDLYQYDRWLTSLGYTVFDVDYRLADGEIHFPLPVEDIELALDWIGKRARDYQVDPHKIALMGRSAGAQMALVSGCRLAKAGPGKVRCVIALYGPTDLVWDYDNPIEPDIIHCREVIVNYLGGAPVAFPALYAQASACSLVTDASPATLLVYGGRDQIVSHLNADRLAPRLKEHKVAFEYLYLPWANHGFDWHFSGLSSQIARQSIAQFLHRYL